jgi:hypothetical protein
MALHWKNPSPRVGKPLGTISACRLSSSGILKYSKEPVRNSQAWPKGGVKCLACYNSIAIEKTRGLPPSFFNNLKLLALLTKYPLVYLEYCQAI